MGTLLLCSVWQVAVFKYSFPLAFEHQINLQNGADQEEDGQLEEKSR